ncbi:MAG: DUF1116 domain-containing protein [Chloroflexota bacterium]
MNSGQTPDRIAGLLADGPRAINVGVAQFAEAVQPWDAGVISVDWRPPAGGPRVAEALRRLAEPAIAARVEAANARLLQAFMAARPYLVDVRPAREMVPALQERVLLHAGPPLAWDAMTGPMQGAAIGAALYEGWAETPDAAEHLLASGGVTFMPCHPQGAVGPMGGITSGSMPLLVVEERTGGGMAFCTLNEGVGRVLRFGANGPEVLERLRWLRDMAGPSLGAAVRQTAGIDLRAIMGRALTMGDEMHQRNIAATLLLLREVAPLLARADLPSEQQAAVVAFIGQTDQFFLNVAMAACKAMADAAHAAGAESSIATAMCRNGVEFGVRLGATGDRWFTAPVNTPQGLYFGGYTAADGNPDIGDSAITETVGVGAFCMAAAPAVVPYVGAGGFEDAIGITNEMLEITAAQNPDFAIPALDGAGAPTGIDVRLVAATGIEPIINTGIAHRQAGVGQVGAGTVRAPIACFEQALIALADALH